MKKLITTHIRENIRSYILILLFFALGTVTGAFTAANYGTEITDYMTEFFDSVRRIIISSPTDSKAVFESTLSSSLKSIALIWILGFTVIGTAGTLFLILKSGFITGFTICFLLNIFSFKGLPVAAASIIFRCIFYFPLIFFLSAESLRLSGILIRMVSGKIKYRTNFRYQLLRYLAIMVASAGITVIYALFEAYAGCFIISELIK